MSEGIQNLLAQCRERDNNELERKQLELERIYEGLPDLLTRASDLTGISEADLIAIASRTAFHVEGMGIRWYHILEIIRSFYISKRQLEEKHEK